MFHSVKEIIRSYIFLVLMGPETTCVERTCLGLLAVLKGWLLEKGYAVRPHSYKLIGPGKHGCNPIHFETDEDVNEAEKLQKRKLQVSFPPRTS